MLLHLNQVAPDHALSRPIFLDIFYSASSYSFCSLQRASVSCSETLANVVPPPAPCLTVKGGETRQTFPLDISADRHWSRQLVHRWAVRWWGGMDGAPPQPPKLFEWALARKIIWRIDDGFLVWSYCCQGVCCISLCLCVLHSMPEYGFDTQTSSSPSAVVLALIQRDGGLLPHRPQ